MQANNNAVHVASLSASFPKYAAMNGVGAVMAIPTPRSNIGHSRANHAAAAKAIPRHTDGQRAEHPTVSKFHVGLVPRIPNARTRHAHIDSTMNETDPRESASATARASLVRGGAAPSTGVIADRVNPLRPSATIRAKVSVATGRASAASRGRPQQATAPGGHLGPFSAPAKFATPALKRKAPQPTVHFLVPTSKKRRIEAARDFPVTQKTWSPTYTVPGPTANRTGTFAHTDAAPTPAAGRTPHNTTYGAPPPLQPRGGSRNILLATVAASLQAPVPGIARGPVINQTSRATNPLFPDPTPNPNPTHGPRVALNTQHQKAQVLLSTPAPSQPYPARGGPNPQVDRSARTCSATDQRRANTNPGANNRGALAQPISARGHNPLTTFAPHPHPDVGQIQRGPALPPSPVPLPANPSRQMDGQLPTPAGPAALAHQDQAVRESAMKLRNSDRDGRGPLVASTSVSIAPPPAIHQPQSTAPQNTRLGYHPTSPMAPPRPTTSTLIQSNRNHAVFNRQTLMSSRGSVNQLPRSEGLVPVQFE